MHQTVGNVLRAYLYSNPPKSMTQSRDIIDQALAIAMHAMQTNIAMMLSITHLLQIGKQSQHAMNSMSMTNFAMPTRSNISMTMLWVRTF
eukprot:8041808-Ditylum_brightwellii.AAC.1